jgi:hypothetical protein
MALTGNQRAYLTARAGVGRAGAIRAGFTPTATQGTAPGSAGGFYVWRPQTLPTTTWTAVKRP